MSDVESRVREFYECVNAGDAERAARVFHPDVVFHDAPELPGGRSYHGREDVAAGLRSLLDMFDSPLIVVDDVRMGDDRGVALIRARGEGRGSGVPVEAEIAHVFSLRDGEIVDVRVFLSHAAGLEAAELQST